MIEWTVINKVLVIDRKKILVRAGIGGVILVGVIWLINSIFRQEVNYQEAKCQIEKMDYQATNSWCNSTGGRTNFEFVSKWRRNGYALIITNNKIITDAETSLVDIRAVAGEVDSEVISPTLIVAKIGKDVADKIKSKYNISGIYFDKVDPGLVKDESDKEWLNTWNSDEQQMTGCICQGTDTWSCNGGCKKLDEIVCVDGGGKWKWWRLSCQCSEGKVWYSNLGRCEDVTVE